LQKKAVLKVEKISKTFTGTKALTDVSFELMEGEVHAIMGENGAGKSTLMNIISGVYKPDSGAIYINGEKVFFNSPKDSQNFGIGFVHQEIALCKHVTVAENVFMCEINQSKKPLVNYSYYYKKAEEILKIFKVKIKPQQNVSQLTISEQQVVEIAKSLSLNCKILILDEPTAAITESETETLFKIINDLKERGISILYISHRMAEIFRICDRVSILRDGNLIGTYNVPEINEDLIVNKMIGRNIGNLYPAKGNRSDEVMLEVNNLCKDGLFNNISFKLHKGEILGFSGLVGAGRSEIAKTICGLLKKNSGEVILNSKKESINSYKDALKKGIVYLTEDRKTEGLLLNLSIEKNISALRVEQVSSGILLDHKKERNQAESFCTELNVKMSSATQKVGNLSGGNQQKVLIAKSLSVSPVLLFIDEPTRGIDVGAKSEIHRLLRNLSDEGKGVIIISSELPEIIGMCDRVIVIHEGSITGTVEGNDICEEKIIRLASGLKA